MGRNDYVPENLRRVCSRNGLPRPDGVVCAYDRRHVSRVPGRGRAGLGAIKYPDPIDRTQDPTDTVSPSWELRNIPAVLLALDPAGLLHYFLDILTRQRLSDTRAITSFLGLFDPDTCPEAFLPALAKSVGFTLRDNATRDVALKRQQIKSAVQSYKTKGLVSAFELLFRS